MFLAGWLMTLTVGLNLTLKLLSSNLSRALVSANLQVSTSGNVRIRRSHLLAVEIMKHWAGAFLHRGGQKGSFRKSFNKFLMISRVFVFPTFEGGQKNKL
jgi:hypothetical protein